jgi:hypothetical protein
VGKVALNPGYNRWKRPDDDRQRYVAEKLRVADAVIGQPEENVIRRLSASRVR